MADRTPSPTQPPPQGTAGISLPRTQSAILEWAETVLLFLLFLSCSIPNRITFNSFSISLAEIFAGIYILWRLTVGGQKGEKTEHTVRWLIRGLFVLAVWSGILWILSINWEMRRSMVSDWWLAALVFLCLLRSPIKAWKRIALLVVLAALPNVILGVLQHALGIGLAAKDFSGWGENASNFPIYGFFQHSNDLAAFLYWPFLVSIGLSFTYRGWKRLVFAVLAVLFALSLYWTISRTTLVTLGILAVLLPFIFFLPRRRTFLIILAVGAAVAALGLALVFLTQPIDQINLLLSGRLNLWSKALEFIDRDGFLLPFGYLTTPPDRVRIFWLPHNIYLLFWISYGWLGMLLLAGAAGFLLWTGWKRYEKLRLHPSAAILWLGLAGVFLINGMASLYFHETHFIMDFIFIAALWTAHLREIDSESPSLPGAAADRTPPLPAKPPPASAGPRRKGASPQAHRARISKKTKNKRK